MKQIIPPTDCPACGSTLELVNEQLFCRNTKCPAQWDKKLEGFASTLKIKGLGPATISKLGVESLPELYELTVSDIQDRIHSERLAEKEESKVPALDASKPITLDFLTNPNKE